jgi:hypothetical protein
VFSFFVRVADSGAHVTQAAFAMDVDPPSSPVPTLTTLSPATVPAGATART